jgi:hypothetical protein
MFGDQSRKENLLTVYLAGLAVSAFRKAAKRGTIAN